MSSTSSSAPHPARFETWRLVAVYAVIFVVLTALLGRLTVLQVLGGTTWEDQAVENYTKSISLPAARGILFDRNGAVLARNVASSSAPPSTYSNAKLGTRRRAISRRSAMHSVRARLGSKGDRRFQGMFNRLLALQHLGNFEDFCQGFYRQNPVPGSSKKDPRHVQNHSADISEHRKGGSNYHNQRTCGPEHDSCGLSQRSICAERIRDCRCPRVPATPMDIWSERFPRFSTDNAMIAPGRSASRPHGAKIVPRKATAPRMHENVGSHERSRSHCIPSPPITAGSPSTEIRSAISGAAFPSA